MKKYDLAFLCGFMCLLNIIAFIRDIDRGFCGSTPATVQAPIKYAANDLYPMLTAAKPGQTITLAKGGSYISSTMIDVKAANVTVDLNGSTLALTSPYSSEIVVHAPGFSIGNGHITKALGVFVRSYADGTSLHDLVTDSINTSAGIGVNQVFFGDVGSSNAKLTNVKTGVGGTVSFYWTWDNAHFQNVNCGGSTGEYGFRQDVATGGHIPSGATLTGITCDQRPNQYLKDCVGIRMGSATITNSLIHGDIRAGQNAATAVGSNVPSLVVTNTVFDLPMQNPQMAIDKGVVATVTGCTFYRGTTHNAIAIDGTTTATLTNNTLQGVPAGMKGLRLWSTLSNPTVKETGTVSK